jgi:hypothetical protein
MSGHIRSGLILLFLGFVLVRISQPYMKSYQFEELIVSEIEPPRPGTHPSDVHDRVYHARAMGVGITPQDVHVNRLAHGYEVQVHYTAPLDFRVYRTQLNFNKTVRTTVGTWN